MRPDAATNDQGQFNLVLLVLLTGSWTADRSGRPLLAGALVGVATAIKLFPGFLLLYFVVRRDWKAIAAMAASLLILTGLTATVLGTAAYRDYVTEVLPRTRSMYESSWMNASFAGFWSRLFNPGMGRGSTLPLWDNSFVAQSAILLCRLAVVVLLAVCVLRHGRRLIEIWRSVWSWWECCWCRRSPGTLTSCCYRFRCWHCGNGCRAEMPAAYLH